MFAGWCFTIQPNSNPVQNNIKWAASSEFGTYRLSEQQRFRRACAFAQSRQNLHCSPIQAVSQEEPSDRKPDPWPLYGWACAVKICHDRMLEDTNSPDAPQMGKEHQYQGLKEWIRYNPSYLTKYFVEYVFPSPYTVLKKSKQHLGTCIV